MMNDVREFLERYSKTPIGEIDAKRAKELLQQAGILTSKSKISKRYSDVFVVREDSILKMKHKKRTITTNED